MTTDEREADVRAIVDFLDAWRYCPVSSAQNAARECLERGAHELLATLPVLARAEAAEQRAERERHRADVAEDGLSARTSERDELEQRCAGHKSKVEAAGQRVRELERERDGARYHEVEAKLATAVEALREIELGSPRGSAAWMFARQALSEIEGGEGS